MGNAASLLTEAKQASGATSDYQLAKALGITTAEVSMYYSGRRHPNEYVCMQIARITGRNFEQVVALVRLEAEKNEKRRNAWQNRLNSMGGIAASFVGGTCLAVTLFVTPTPAEAAQTIATGAATICIM